MPLKPKRKKNRLVIRKIPVHEVTDNLIEDMWKLFSDNYKEVDKGIFIEDLKEKDYAFCGFDSENNELGGFTTVKIYCKEIDGKKIWVYFSGDTMFKKKYWGQKKLHSSVGLHLLQHRLKYPFQPFYWFLIVMGYRTYLTMARNTPLYWPRYNRKMPSNIQRITQVLASDRFGNNFDSETGLIAPQPGSGNLAEHVTPVTDELKRTIPEILFFTQNNPNYAKGYEMACLGKLNGSFFLRIWHKYILSRIRKFTQC